ncbi:MAG: thioredoxin domain-containing protein, partial [Byssovorax sp.]
MRVIDLGLAPFLALARRTPAVGESLWMAPEQADARPPITAAADVWSLGLVAFFLLVGKPYWKGATAGSMLPAAVHQEVVFDPLVAASTRAAELGMLGRIPAGFDAWFARCVARLPSDRFPDAHAALEALRASWGASARAPLPSFSLADAGGSTGPARGPLPSFPLGFEGAGGSGPPPQGPPPAPAYGPAWGPPPQGPPFPGAPQGYSYPQQGYGPPPQPTWGVAQPSRGSNPLPWILGALGLLLVLFIGGGVAVYFVARPPAMAAPIVAPPSTFEQGSITISSRDPSWGNRTAPVTLIEFGDFQCPFCKRANATLAALKMQYGPETLRIVWKNNPLPFHKGARPAAVAAMAVLELGGNDAFWRFHDHAFAGQDALTDESFASWALDSGVDMVKWRAAVSSPASDLEIDTGLALAKEAGVRGTPAFFVNGVLLSGAQPLDKFVEVIEAQKIAARDALAAGTRPEDVYIQLSRRNKATALPPKDESAAKDETTVWRVPVGVSPSRGLPSAPVTIVEFGDLQCPFCR